MMMYEFWYLSIGKVVSLHPVKVDGVCGGIASDILKLGTR
jgi:hypothetical protein